MRVASFRWWFESRGTGRITVAQFPNPPLWIAMAAGILERLVDGPFGTAARVVFVVALLWWAADEVIRGVNPWRRLMGATVAVWVAAGMIA